MRHSARPRVLSFSSRAEDSRGARGRSVVSLSEPPRPILDEADAADYLAVETKTHRRTALVALRGESTS